MSKEPRKSQGLLEALPMTIAIFVIGHLTPIGSTKFGSFVIFCLAVWYWIDCVTMKPGDGK